MDKGFISFLVIIVIVFGLTMIVKNADIMNRGVPEPAGDKDNEEIAMETIDSTVVLETSMGNIEIELDAKNAPISTKNFLGYVNDGFYEGTIFHRVIDGFMVQGGGFDKDMKQKDTKAPIKNEATNGLNNEMYTIAMARTSVIDSATSQFFINVNDNDFLDHRDNTGSGYGYAVFGKVTSGTDVVDKIKGVATKNSGMHQNVPIEPITIKKAYVKK
jgi:peptidyl-prolyl cis-trans isomerase B (cyclophilin B)